MCGLPSNVETVLRLAALIGCISDLRIVCENMLATKRIDHNNNPSTEGKELFDDARRDRRAEDGSAIPAF